jgi:ATP-dependent RNA helicase RhlE
MPFEGLGLNAHLLKAIKESGYTRPTPIQTAAIPPAMEGRDIIGSAQTGTGKTAAFLLPILHQMLLSKSKGGTRGLVLAPTRELAVQVDAQFRVLAKHAGLRSVAVYGGAAMDPQTRALRAGVDIVIATPGRLLDHLERGNLRCQQVGFLVLDEADRMLDMGFLPDIKKIIAAIPATRQTMLFSATMPSEIARLAKNILRDPMIVQVGGGDVMAKSIRHAAYPVPQHLKGELLLTLMRETEMPSVLIFTRTRQGADRLAHKLTHAGFLTGALHSDRTQSQRLATLESFRRGKVKILVATDIAARGIDVANISHVFNYDLPNTPETYVHRVGRTARAEASGDAITLVAPDEERALRIIERTLGPAIPRVKLPDFNYRAASTQGTHSPPPDSRPAARTRTDRRPTTSNSARRYSFKGTHVAPSSGKAR